MQRSPGENFLLIFLLSRCTRGSDGIPVMGDFIMKHYKIFEKNFHAFCIKLVTECHKVTRDKKKSYMAHCEGLHRAYSGMNFIDTLTNMQCRQGLLDYAAKFGRIFDRLIVQRAQTYLRSDELVEMGQELRNHVVLAIQKKKFKYAGKYNCMDAMRCLSTIVENLIPCSSTPYDQDMHHWFILRQSQKYKQEKANMLKYFKIIGAKSINDFIDRLRRGTALGATITFATIFILLCETRQAINKYGARAICYLIEQYKCNSKLRAHTSGIREQLRTGNATNHPHTPIIIEGMLKFLHVSTTQLKQKRPRKILKAIDIAYALGVNQICSKVSLDGITEWAVLRNCLSIVYYQFNVISDIWQNLNRAAAAAGVSVYDKAGIRKSKKQVKKELEVYAKSPHKTGRQKRSYRSLESEFKAKGGVPVSPWGQGKRVRISKAEMQAFIDKDPFQATQTR